MASSEKKKGMTNEHKDALAVGRREGRVVKDYLEALRSNRGRPGRKRTPESVAARLAAIETELAVADPVRELHLVQERLDLQRELASFEVKVDLAAIEQQFIAVAKGYGQRRGITYSAWREVGVAPTVLKSAGIRRAD
jgi:hypothetical protein